MSSAAPSSHEPAVSAAALEAVLEVLLLRCQVEARPDLLRRAALDGAVEGEQTDDWTSALDVAATATGLRLRWTQASAEEAARLCRADLPVVGRTTTGAFLVLEGQRAGRVTLRTVPDVQGPRTVAMGSLAARFLGLPAETGVSWALVEPALPASPILPGKDGGPTPSPVRRLRALLQVEAPDLLAIVLYAVVIGVLSLATPLAMQVLINWLAFGALQQPIIVLSLVLFAFLGLAAGLRSIQRLAVEIVQRRIFVRMVADLSTRLTRVRVSAFDRRQGPELLNRFFDVLTVQKALAGILLDGIGAALQAFVGLALLALYHPVLLAFDVVLIGALFAILLVLGRGAQKTAIKESKAKYAVASWMEELARHPMLFKLADGDQLALSRADELARGYLDARHAHWRVYFRQFVGSAMLQAVAAVSLLGLCGGLVLEGELTVGQLVAAEFIVTSALAGFSKFVGKLDSVYDLLAGIDKLGTLVDLPQERVAGLSTRGEGPATLRLRGVHVGHSAHHQQAGPIDLEVVAGDRLAILGRPGVGKSTLADVIIGVRRPLDGVVERDGADLEDLRPAAVHRDSLLLRNADIIEGTLGDNVTLSRPGATSLQARQALSRVGLASTLQDLPDGLDTHLGPLGAPLSSSGALRLVVARALVARPRLLVLDGLFDGLPSADRQELIALLVDAQAPWTLLVFTELPEVAADFDRVLKLTTEGLHDPA